MTKKFKIDRAEHDSADARAARDGLCPVCGKVIPVDTAVVWVGDVGVFHPDCVEYGPEETA